LQRLSIAIRDEAAYLGAAEPTVPPPAGESSTGKSGAMMRTGRVLRWLYIGRMVVAVAIFVAALTRWLGPGWNQVETLVATVALLSAAAMTGFGLWWVEVRCREPGRDFLYVQLVYDVLLVTAVVHVTGGPNSPYPPLYILVITAAALLLPLPGGMLIGALASILFIGDAVFAPLTEPGMPDFLRVALFAVVAVATAALGDRLRRAGTALGAVETELRRLRLDTNELLAAIDTALVTVDAAGRLVHVNSATTDLLGLELEARRGEPVLDDLDRRAPGLGTLIRRTAATRVPVGRFEIRQRREGGDRFLGVRTTVLDRDGAPWVTAVLQDITETKVIDELIRRADRLQATAELGASLAHEIRNPLASIRSAVEQLAGERLAAPERGMLRALVVKESERLSRLLSEFMEFSRVDAPRWTSIDLGAVILDAVELVSRHPDRSAGVRIDFFQPAAPLQVDGDRDLLHRALFNLLLNGVQHAAPDGLVAVELEETSEVVPGTVRVDAPVRVSVRDSGPGVRPEDMERVFDPFFTRRDGGTGLGLALVHRAVQAHGGEVVVENAPDGGARFTIYLPAHAGEEQAHGVAEAG
jgi:two-component system, NtrC family, sensor histidine kinase PilS